MTPNENEIILGIQAQAVFTLKNVTDIVSAQVTDVVLAAAVNAAVTAKLNDQTTKFVAAVTAVTAETPSPDVDLTLPLV